MPCQDIERQRAACPVAPSGGSDPKGGNRPSRPLKAVDDGETDRCILAAVGVWSPREVAGTVRRGELTQLSTLIATIGIGQTVHNGGQVMAVGLP